MRLLSIISLILACFSSSTSQSAIDGPASVCEDECHEYSITSSQEVYWEIQGGVVDNNTGPSVQVCWEEAQMGSITVSTLDNSINDALSVTINELPNASIQFPLYPACTALDSLDQNGEFMANDFCMEVCGAGISVLQIGEFNASSNYSWIITGDDNHTETIEGIEITWPAEGYGSVSLIEENSAGCLDTAYVCIEILDEPSIAINLINNQVDLNNVCQNQNIYLEAISNQNLSFQWESSDGQTHEGSQADFSFDQAGSYLVTVRGMTDCQCTVDEVIQIKVIDFTAPIIDCIGTTCIAQEATYYAIDICGSYNWSISPNGTIIEGGTITDNYITVEWNAGPTGELSLSTSSCDDAAICTETNVVLIPVMGSSVSIDGPSEVCHDEKSIYTTQKYEGASYVWDLQGNGYIIEGNGSHEITVQWSPYYSTTNAANLSVEITHCFLECSSRGEKDIIIEERFGVMSNQEYCEDTDGYFYAFVGYDNAACDWAMVTPDNQVITIATNVSDLSIPFDNGPGIYEIISIAVSDDYCNKEERSFVNVVESPDPITEIVGSTQICLGEPIAYSINLPDDDLEYIWTINDGVNLLTFYGQEIFTQWDGPGPYTITVQVRNPENQCISEDFIQEYFILGNVDLTGDQMVCEGDISSYELMGIESTNIEWNIFPALAGVPAPQVDGSIDVQWLESGTHTLTGSYCNQVYSFNIEVNGDLSGFNYDKGVCPGDLAQISMDPTSFGITVTDEFNINVGNTDPVSTSSGHYIVETTDANGCPTSESIFIEEYVVPEVHLSSSDLRNLCMPNGNARLDALSTNDILSYTWYKNGVDLNINAPSIDVTEDGLYRVVVINQYGCEGADVLEVECRDSQCDCRPDGGVRYDYQRGMYCNEFTFTNSSFHYIPGTLSYNFDDPGSVNNITTDENPSHTFSQAGHFIVVLSGVVPHATTPGATCPAQFIEFITVDAAADFTNLPACAGTPMEFNENANFLPGFSITDYAWDFGDPASGASNTSSNADPTHNYALAGNYDVTLTITTNTGCQSVITKTVKVNEAALIDFDMPVSSCAGEAIYFQGVTDGYEYEWDFDNAPGQFVQTKEAYHIFPLAGDYDVTFTSTNIYGCESSISKTISIVDNTFGGIIAMDQSMPMCDGQSVNLSGPNGGFAYLWSNGETTETINTTEQGIYSVTVTSNDGCEFIPDPVIVNTIRPINPIITGYLYGTGFQAETFVNEMEICEGEYIGIGTQYFFNANYQWSTGGTSSFVNNSDINNLSPGEHIFTLTVTDAVFNCPIEADPFKVIVRPLPAIFEIDSDQSGICEGETFTFSVVSPQADLNYYWSNGMTGTSITVTAPGNYRAQAVNEYGCTRWSNSQIIRSLPDINRVLTGCQEACFPDTICVAYSPSVTSYTWFLDGTELTGQNGEELIINEVGDYQVELESSYGCVITSEVLSISPKTTDQTLEGIVFMDPNGNGVHDTGEELITGASVNIMSGNTVISSQTTDVNGHYLFDPAPASDALVVFDTLGLGLNLSSSTLLYGFELKSCNEELVQDFPLNKECISETFDVLLYTCEGEPIEYDGVFYSPGDVTTVTTINSAGCESIINLEVFAFPASVYQLITSPTCENQDEGILSIDIIAGIDLEFSLDNGMTYTNNPEFNNLPAGDYNLIINNSNGCINFESFTIPAISMPLTNFVVSPTCEGENDGTLTIDNSASANMEFAVDDNSTYSPVTNITNLSAGDHTLYTIDDNGCAQEYEFTIGVYAEPELSYDTYNSCSGHYLGALFIMTTETNLEFSLNGVDYSDQTDFLDLEVGDYTLYVETADNCIHTFDFTIEAFGLIDIDLDTKNACEGEANGEVTVIHASGLEFSLDGLNFQGTDSFSDLAPGDYIVHAQNADQCPVEIPFTIYETEAAELVFNNPEVDCSSDEVELEVTNMNGSDVTYLWSNGETSNVIAIDQPGIYEVTIDNGCEQRAHSWDIKFEYNEFGLPAFIPNVFTPESEDVNAELKPLLNKDIELLDYSFIIFDRWGNKMYQSEDNHEFWDGTYLSDQVKPGVYVWRLKMKYTACQDPITFEKYGDVTLLR